MKKNLILILVACCLFSCMETPKSHTVKEISLKETNGSIEEIIDSVVYIPLAVNEQSALSQVHKIIIDDSLIYLGDFNNSKLSVYNKSGNIKYALDKRGHGKGEYLEIRNFTIANDKLYAIDNFKNEINIFNKNTGVYIESKKTDIIASDIVALNGGNEFLMAVIPNGHEWSIDQERYLVFRTDQDFKTTEALFPYDKDYYEPLSRRNYFSQIDNGVIFSSFAFDGYYKVQKNDIQKVCIVQDNNIPNDKINDIDSYTNKKYKYITNTPIVCNNYIYTEVNNNGITQSYVYDNKNKKLYENRKDAQIKMTFIIGNDKDAFICYIPDIRFYKEMIKYGLKSADSPTEDFLNNGGSALVLYKMKK